MEWLVFHRLVHDIEEVLFLSESSRLRFEPDSGGHFADAKTIIHFRRQHQRIHATLTVVVTGLK